MRARLLWVLLGASLTANVFFAAGALYALYGKHGWRSGSDASINLATERLALSLEQRTGLLALRDKVREGRERPRGTRDERRRAFLEELGKPTFDRAGVIAMMEARSAKRRERFADLAQDLHAYLATLSPGQREKFLVMARERGFLRGLFGRPRPPRAER